MDPDINPRFEMFELNLATVLGALLMRRMTVDLSFLRSQIISSRNPL